MISTEAKLECRGTVISDILFIYSFHTVLSQLSSLFSLKTLWGGSTPLCAAVDHTLRSRVNIISCWGEESANNDLVSPSICTKCMYSGKAFTVTMRSVLVAQQIIHVMLLSIINSAAPPHCHHSTQQKQIHCCVVSSRIKHLL